MSKKNAFLLGLTALFLFCSGCGVITQWGVARLPDANMLFITTADEDVFVAKKDLVIPYQPVGFLEIRTRKIQLCGGNLEGMYVSLERAMAKELVDKARKSLGAEAVIDYSWDVSSSYKQYMEAYAKASEQNPYCGMTMLPGVPFAYVANVNTVKMKGTAVKAKK